MIYIELLATVSLDDAVGIFEIAFDARTQHLGNQRISGSDSAASGFVRISGTDPAQSRPDLLVTEPLFTGVIQRAMVRENQVRTRTDLYAFRRNFDALFS